MFADNGPPVASEVARECYGWRLNFGTHGFFFDVQSDCGSHYNVKVRWLEDPAPRREARSRE